MASKAREELKPSLNMPGCSTSVCPDMCVCSAVACEAHCEQLAACECPETTHTHGQCGFVWLGELVSALACMLRHEWASALMQV